MALANYSLVYQSSASPFVPTTGATPVNIDLDDLLYSPEDHQQSESDKRHINDPYAPPQSTQRRTKLRKRAGTPYLPPQNQFTQYAHNEAQQPPPYGSMHTQIYHNTRLSAEEENQRVHEVNGAYEGMGEYVHDPSGDYDSAGFERRRLDQPPRNSPPRVPAPAPDYRQPNYFGGPYESTESTRFDSSVEQKVNYNFQSSISPPSPQAPLTNPYPLPGQTPSGFQGQTRGGFQQQNPSPTFQKQNPSPGFKQQRPPSNVSGLKKIPGANNQGGTVENNEAPSRPIGFTKVEGSNGGSNTKTQLHAVLDYDDDYYDDVPGDTGVTAVNQQVTPLQGPILLKNGSVPVVPLFSYPTVNNGSFYQIPILWTALSVALGYELEGNVIQGVPCVKRNYQLYCPTAGTSYPDDKIQTFIDENRALMRRMYGKFITNGAPTGGARRRRAPGVPDPHPHEGDSFFGQIREKRQSSKTPPPFNINEGNSSKRVDACESKTEIVTPYWALNSARKLRAVVNTMHFEQAIHQEVCSKSTTGRCSGDCGCEQKYKWHRLLAYDPDEDCAGIFMDWFLFPSCCVCRCNP